MDAGRRSSGAIVLVPAPCPPARRARRSLAWRLIGALPALISTPQRALFTAGVAFGLVSPSLIRFLADRTLGAGLRSLARPAPGQPVQPDEIIIERILATRIVVRRGKR